MKLLVRFTLCMLLPLITMQQMSALNLKLKKKDTPMIDYNKWVPQQQWPADIAGVEQFYPSTQVAVSDGENTDNDTIAVVAGRLSVPGLDARQCFLAALVFASDNLDDNESIEGIDYTGLNFSISLKTTQGNNNNETSYTRSITCKACDEGVDFNVSEIDCHFRDKGIIPRTIRLEKLQPDKNKRHAELVKQFVEINSGYLGRMSDYMRSRKGISSPNFDKLMKGASVCEGMNMDEVTILLGPPLNKRRSGEKYRWIYANDFIIIFTDGVVSRIVD